MFLVSRVSSFRTYFIFTAAGVVSCGGRETSPHKSLQCRLYIFWSFGITGLILSQFENRVPPKPVLAGHEQCCTITLLYMNRLNKTESAIFVSLMCSLLPDDIHSECFPLVEIKSKKSLETATLRN